MYLILVVYPVQLTCLQRRKMCIMWDYYHGSRCGAILLP